METHLTKRRKPKQMNKKCACTFIVLKIEVEDFSPIRLETTVATCFHAVAKSNGAAGRSDHKK